MPGHKRVSHFASLAKYAVAFFHDVALLGDARQFLLQASDFGGLIIITT